MQQADALMLTAPAIVGVTSQTLQRCAVDVLAAASDVPIRVDSLGRPELHRAVLDGDEACFPSGVCSCLGSGGDIGEGVVK